MNNSKYLAERKQTKKLIANFTFVPPW